MTSYAKLILAGLLGASGAVAQGRGVCVPTPNAVAYPRMPFQFTQTVPAAEGQQGTGMNARRSILIPQVPADRIAVIESIAIKGQHPPKTYVALELQTVLRYGNEWRAARHFLYTQFSGSDSIPIHIRETTKIFADSGTPVVLGLQHPFGARIEPITITITGTLVDVCAYGR